MSAIAASVKVGNEDKVAAAAEMMRSRGIRIKHAGMMSYVRLPIVGLNEANDQPVQAGSWTIGFVGELLNFREVEHKAECDADVVAKTWVMQGPQGFRLYDGFWAIIAIQEKQRQLHCLCDYLAQKPLYYRLDEAAAANELDAIASFGPVTPDRLYLSDVCKWGFCPDARRTPYAEVSRVLPGEHVAFDDRGNVSRNFSDALQPAGELKDLKSALEQATCRRVLCSDVPVACLLSGGLNSSIVYTLAIRYGDVIPYFVHQEMEECDDASEVVRAAQVAAFNLMPNNPQRSPLEEVRIPHTRLTPLLRKLQEPTDLEGRLQTQINLADAISERVCLTGDGANELFGGHSRAMRYDSQATDVLRDLICWRLPLLDRVMMKRGIETRSPFLARQVAQITLNLPYADRRGRNCLRALFKDDLPQQILRKSREPVQDNGQNENYRVKLVDAFVDAKWPK
jgi:asparagine synthase (glutamine-hydrolysing)